MPIFLAHKSESFFPCQDYWQGNHNCFWVANFIGKLFTLVAALSIKLLRFLMFGMGIAISSNTFNKFEINISMTVLRNKITNFALVKKKMASAANTNQLLKSIIID
jgi:hypothetical protein